jgi:hypothetical protein
MFTGFLVCTISLLALSQNLGSKYSPEERAQFQTEWMNENLNLDENQSVQIEKLNLEYAKKMEKVKSTDGKLSKLKLARSISEEKDEKLKKILNEKQFKFYLNKRREMRSKVIEMAKEQKKQS